MEENTPQFSLGLIGLGVMGSHLARNFASKKNHIAVFNRTAEITDEFMRNHGNPYLHSAHTLEELVQKLAKPRVLLLMVQAGKPVDQVIDALLPLLETGDIIVDLGNSFYRDTEKREIYCQSKGVLFGGCGISGGEKGALEGPSLMLGGSPELGKTLMPLLESIAAKDFNGDPCVAYCGTGGAGHYVKMVHNGIEYGLMQCISEIYEVLRYKGYSLEAISDLFKTWQQDQLGGFLTELTSKVLQVKDAEGQFMVEKILDKAGQKGTGAWTVKDALDRGVPIPTITEAVMARALSSFWEIRQKLSKDFAGTFGEKQSQEDPKIAMANEQASLLEHALLAAFVSTFIQGLELLRTASFEEHWELKLEEVVRVWQGGCIIRSSLLKVLKNDLVATSLPDTPHFFMLPDVQDTLKKTLPDLQQVVQQGVQAGLPVSGLSSALAYVHSLIQARGNAFIIQALRDAFGAHTYERLDQPGVFHTEWEEE